jgi:hypothetical protein
VILPRGSPVPIPKTEVKLGRWYCTRKYVGSPSTSLGCLQRKATLRKQRGLFRFGTDICNKSASLFFGGRGRRSRSYIHRRAKFLNVRRSLRRQKTCASSVNENYGASIGRLNASSSSRARRAKSFRAPALKELAITALLSATQLRSAPSVEDNHGVKNFWRPKPKSKAPMMRCSPSKSQHIAASFHVRWARVEFLNLNFSG